MLEILVLAIVVFAGFRRGYGKRSYHRNYRLRRVTLATQSAAGALDSGAVVTNAVTAAATETYRLISVNASYSWAEIAAQIDDACTFGFAHSDYTATEVDECLEATGSIDKGDKIAQEQANRLVRYVGTIGGDTGAVTSNLPFNNGRRLKTRLNWLMSTGDTLNLWIRNASGVIWTTGSRVTIAGDLWIKDGV